MKENIGMLQNLQSIAQEEAKRSALAQSHLEEFQETSFDVVNQGQKQFYKLKKISRRESIRFSLPARIRLNSVEFDAM